MIESDGSRPVLFVQEGTINLEAPELHEGLAARWEYDAKRFLGGIKKVAESVGAVQFLALGNRRFGTAFVIAPGLVVTNRHVLEEAARLVEGSWRWKYDVEVDFLGEYQRPTEKCFQLEDVVFCGPDAINRRINFANLDLAVIRVGGDLANLPAPLSLERTVDPVAVRDARQPPIYVIGFPAQPQIETEQAGNAAPRAGLEYEEVLEKLYQNRFGSKRWAPDLVEAGAGQLTGDTHKWIMSHDASTLGGSSGPAWWISARLASGWSVCILAAGPGRRTTRMWSRRCRSRSVRLREYPGSETVDGMRMLESYAVKQKAAGKWSKWWARGLVGELTSGRVRAWHLT